MRVSAHFPAFPARGLAQERIRTSTPLPALDPESSASASSATWALIMRDLAPCASEVSPNSHLTAVSTLDFSPGGESLRVGAWLRLRPPRRRYYTELFRIATNEDGEALSVGDAVLVDEESTVEGADEHEGRVYCLLLDLIRTSPELTPRERKILELGYLEGMKNEEIRRRVGPPTNIGVESAIAIRKLRTIMRRRGYAALPVEAPVLHASGGRPPRL